MLKFAVLQVGKSLLGLLVNPIVLAIAAITAAVYALYRAFKLIDEQTGIFSDTFKELKDVFLQQRVLFSQYLIFF